MSRTIDVLRLQMFNWRYRTILPLLIVFLVLLLNLAVFAMIEERPADGSRIFSGGMAALYFTAGAGYLQTMTQIFPFALGLGVTRRAFAAGVGLLIVLEAAVYGVLVLLLGAVEQATSGWGVRVQFFDLDVLHQDNPVLGWLVLTVPFVLISLLFATLGVVFKRWGQIGIYAVLLAVAAVLVAAVALVTYREWWPAVGSWLVGQPVLPLATVYPLALAAVVAAGAWLALRRATP